MPEMKFPAAWLRLDEAAVALGVAEDAAEMYSKTDAWRAALDDQSRKVFALEDVRATAKTLRTPFTIDHPAPGREKRDLRRGARPRWSRWLGRRS